MTENPSLGSRRPESQSGSTMDTDPPTEASAAPAAEDEAGTDSQAASAAPGQTSGGQDGAAEQDEDLLARTRAGQTWVAIILFAIILILLLIFIIENTKSTPITYFGQTTHLPLAVAMLFAAVAGVLLTAIAGTLRILQLRRRVKRARQ